MRNRVRSGSVASSSAFMKSARPAVTSSMLNSHQAHSGGFAVLFGLYERSFARGTESAGERIVDHAVLDSVARITFREHGVVQQLQLREALWSAIVVGVEREIAGVVVAE